ncbi:hypothetical protein JCM30760_21210 [Thiomicrorhabdus hydrogeniphila]
MRSQFTDTDLSRELSVEIFDDYKTGLEFINSNPDYSLHKFRDVTNAVVSLIAKKFDIDLQSEKLVDNIRLLFDSQVINHSLHNELHQVRTLGNSGVHKNVSFDGEKEFYIQRQKQLIKSALIARKHLVSIFEDVYFLIKNIRPPTQIIYVHIGMQDYRETLYNASVSGCFKEKLKAGIIFESIIKEQSYTASMVVSNDFIYHLDGLEKSALAFYEASYKISAKVDRKLFEFSSGSDKETLILKNCALEPLYKYASLALAQDNDKELKERGRNVLKVAADRGYALAESLMGGYLYEEKNFELALDYLLSSVNKDEPSSLLILFYYYTDGYACEPDHEKALKYLRKAVDLGSADALACLGIVYHKGEYCLRDEQKAKELLEESIAGGSVIGKQYLTVEFNDLPGKMMEEFKQLATDMKAALKAKKSKPITIGKKIKPNEQCPCGSGLKYKKCCQNNLNTGNARGQNEFTDVDPLDILRL